MNYSSMDRTARRMKRYYREKIHQSISRICRIQLEIFLALASVFIQACSSIISRLSFLSLHAAGKAIKRESIFECVASASDTERDRASWHNEYFNTCERISSPHHPPPRIYRAIPVDLTLKSTYRSLALSSPVTTKSSCSSSTSRCDLAV